MTFTHLPKGVHFEKREGAEVLLATTECCTLEMSANGAHIARWAPRGSQDVLWLSPLATFAPGKHVRGGIPLVGPWFGRGRSGSEVPQHGWFREARWRFDSVDLDERGSLTLTLSLEEIRSKPGCDVASAVLTARVDESLDLSLTVTAGDHGAELETAFHTYFLVSDVREVTLRGLAGVPFTDAARGRQPGIGRDVETFADATDNVFESAPPLTLHDPGLDRCIAIDQRAGSRTVVWTPWEKDVQATADIPDDQWTRFVCVETAVSEDGFVHLAPGESFTLGTRYSIRPA